MVFGAQIGVKRLPKTIKNITFVCKTSGRDFSCYGKVPNLDFCNTFHTKTLFLQCDQTDILKDFGPTSVQKCSPKWSENSCKNQPTFRCEFSSILNGLWHHFEWILGPEMPQKSDQKNSPWK